MDIDPRQRPRRIDTPVSDEGFCEKERIMADTISISAGVYFQEMKKALKMIRFDSVDRYADELFGAWQDERTVYVFGNGGSAYCASHHVTDYIKTARVDGQKALRAVSLVDNIGLLTALGNDISYDNVFQYPIEAMANKGDIAVAISCSGNSKNVVKALECAKDHGLLTTAITGFTGGTIGNIVDIHINIPNENYGIIEDLQLSVGHIVSQRLCHRVQEFARTRL